MLELIRIVIFYHIFIHMLDLKQINSYEMLQLFIQPPEPNSNHL